MKRNLTDTRIEDIIVALEQELDDVYESGASSGHYKVVPEIVEDGIVYAAMVAEDGVAMSYDTESDPARRVCAYAHETVHKYFPGLAVSTHTAEKRAKDELTVEYMTERVLTELLFSDDDGVKVAAQAGLKAQRSRNPADVYGSISSTGWERYQSGGGAKGFYDTLFDMATSTTFALPRAAETAVRSWVGGFLETMGGLKIVDSKPNVTNAMETLAAAAYADYKAWATAVSKPPEKKK